MSDISNSLQDSAGASPVEPPPSPMIQESPPGDPAHEAVPPAVAVRIWCAFVLSLCAGMLGLGLYLTPSPDGFGKHQGLFGMPPCGFYVATGLPCPTCGCTTAVSHFSHGHILTSLLTQPFGFGVAVMATLLLPLTVFGLITGRWVGPSMFLLSWYWRYWLFGGLGLLVFGWIYKIIRVKYG